jgi:hypothetical protein
MVADVRMAHKAMIVALLHPATYPQLCLLLCQGVTVQLLSHEPLMLNATVRSFGPRQVHPSSRAQACCCSLQRGVAC